ncbi:MAG: nitroreductase family protein [Verrucomicrobia bacterium]|nr:nitroreductase family protein [Verrucomicrobiota bacterium]MBU6446091.1 nitroreductase family protein [Verrucomicrobiota bacterium]MDE3047384.1 nitroreductase family protein [Verrucomicrobiota bacterium]
MFDSKRKPDHPIQPLILNRWSPRSMSGEPIPNETIEALFEAARWAPSSYNNQPWRFLYGKKGSPHFPLFFDLLTDFNKLWCEKAALLGVIASEKIFEKTKKPSITHAFDTGAAWENLALEGNARNLVVHGMQGFDYEKARASLKIPDAFEVLAMFAVGKPAPKETLPEDLLKRETPSTRKKVSEITFEGHWK